jgi:fused signal recognition particle receptor
MDELDKIARVVARDSAAPVRTLLVMDAVTGQNGILQARRFHELLGVDGIALTKLDGTAKGGVAVAIARELSIPIVLIGVGEGAHDLQPFDAEDFVGALLTTA